MAILGVSGYEYHPILGQTHILSIIIIIIIIITTVVSHDTNVIHYPLIKIPCGIETNLMRIQPTRISVTPEE